MAYKRRKRLNETGKKASAIIMRQIILCSLIFLVVITANKIDTPLVNKTVLAVKTQFTKEASISGIRDAGKHAVIKIKDGTNTVVASLTQGKKGLDFSTPTDAPGSYSVSASPDTMGKTIEFQSSKEMQVYSAAGGTVSEISDDREGNKYIKIYHGNEMYTMYGGCTSTYVNVLEKVKRGQIIASVAEGEDNKLLFEIWDGEKLVDPAKYISF